MRYVLDASVAVCWVLSRPSSPKAIQLRDEYGQAIHQLIAPSIFLGEIASALTKSERQAILPVGQASVLFAKILRTPPALHPYESLLVRAVDISSQTRSGLYDCLYVALAERESCELVTDDARLVNNLQVQFPFIRNLSSI